MLFISPPFGNYLDLKHTMSIRGSYTLNPRPGLLSQILKTLRYSFQRNGWINKIGLRNKGLDYAIENYSTNSIISIAILNSKEIKSIHQKIPRNMNIELNVSCPNHTVIGKDLGIFLNPQRKWCILKLSPLTTFCEIDKYYEQGFRQFHCCNTLPVPSGGLSGPSLIPITGMLVKYIKTKKNVTVIAGGGIQNYHDVEYYKSLGADHFSISTLIFNPLKFLR